MVIRLLSASAMLLLLGAALADEPAGRRRDALLTQMRELAEQTKVEMQDSGSQAELIPSPVFRYDDQPRRFLDATIWAWTNQGYPVAFQKIEAKLHQSTGEPQWGYCFTSLSEEKLAVQWSPERQFRSKEPGIEWQVVPEGPVPAARNGERKRQARALARGFGGRIVIDPKTNRSAEMRLLPTPLLEYSEPETELLRGAAFGMEINGTNPDVLVLLEVREQQGKKAWNFAAARMTTGGITLNYGDKKVWQAEFVQPHTGPYPTWTFFPTPRTPVAEEATP